MFHSLQAGFKQERRRILVGFWSETLALSAGVFFMGAAAAKLDGLSPFRGGALFSGLLASCAFLATWWRVRHPDEETMRRQVGKNCPSGEDFCATIWTLQAEPGGGQPIERLFLGRAGVHGERHLKSGIGLRGTVFFVPAFALLLFYAADGSGSARVLPARSSSVEAISTSLRDSIESGAKFLSTTQRSTLEQSFGQFREKKLSSEKMDFVLQDSLKELRRVESRILEKESSETEGLVGAGGTELSQAIASLELSRMMLDVSSLRSEPPSKPGANQGSGAGAGLPSASSPKSDGSEAGSINHGAEQALSFSGSGKGSEKFPLAAGYRWPSRFDPVVRKYFENEK